MCGTSKSIIQNKFKLPSKPQNHCLVYYHYIKYPCTCAPVQKRITGHLIMIITTRITVMMMTTMTTNIVADDDDDDGGGESEASEIYSRVI